MSGLHHSGGVADAQPPATGFYPFRMLVVAHQTYCEARAQGPTSRCSRGRRKPTRPGARRTHTPPRRSGLPQHVAIGLVR